jgi:hypothetical protein
MPIKTALVIFKENKNENNTMFSSPMLSHSNYCGTWPGPGANNLSEQGSGRSADGKR